MNVSSSPRSGPKASPRLSSRSSPARWRWACRRSSCASPMSGRSPARSGASRSPCRCSTPGCGSASAARRGRTAASPRATICGRPRLHRRSVLLASVDRQHQRRQCDVLRHHRADLGGAVRLAAPRRPRHPPACSSASPSASPAAGAAGAKLELGARRRGRRSLRHRHRRVLRPLFSRRAGGARRPLGGARHVRGEHDHRGAAASSSRSSLEPRLLPATAQAPRALSRWRGSATPAARACWRWRSAGCRRRSRRW